LQHHSDEVWVQYGTSQQSFLLLEIGYVHRITDKNKLINVTISIFSFMATCYLHVHRHST